MAKVVKDLYCFSSKESTYKKYIFRKRQTKVKKITTNKSSGTNNTLSLRKYNPITRRHELFELKKAKK